MAQTRSERDAAAARLSKAQLRHELSVLRAPADATVLEVAERPAGSVMREAETLMRLVPADVPLIAESQVDTRDVARVRVGDLVAAQVRGLAVAAIRHGLWPAVEPDAGRHCRPEFR